MSREVDRYGEMFKRVRFDAARRLGREELYSRTDAARLIGISESGLKKIETGISRPSFEMMEKMAAVYNVQMGDLLPSSAPRGPQADRILAPVLLLPPMMRETFIVQMEAFARITLAGITEATEIAMAENTSDSFRPSVPSSGPSPASTSNPTSGVPGLERIVEFDEEDGKEGSFAERKRKTSTSTTHPA